MYSRIALLLLTIASPLFAREADRAQVPLDELFANPPEESKPWCYWYWLNNHISKDGVTKDLEAMHKAGIKLAMIGNIEGGDGVKMFSPEWYEITRHALSEAKRLSLEIMMFNGPGWSQSGGPWIKPGQSMRRVAWHEVSAKGGGFSARFRPENADGSQNIAVLAVPKKPTVVIDGVEKDGGLRFSHDSAFTARSLTVAGKGQGELYAVNEGGRELVARIGATGGNPRTDFLATEAEVFGFPDVTAREFELVGGFEGGVALGSEPKVAQYVEKQMGRMHPTPSPTWESYQFPDSVEPGDTSALIRSGEILNLTDKLAADGTLRCTLPEGEWTVIHFGMVPTGAKNGPAPPEATGLECDKMSKAHTKHHFDSMFGKLIKELTPEEKAAWVGITIDSYEVGAQNWTDGFAGEFAKRNGYDPILLLPVMTGRMIDSAKASDRFLWDLRRTVADMIAENYVAGLREEAHKNGLRLWCENYGHWGFPGEFTVYGGHSDEVGGEFWFQHRQNLGNIECRAASSTAHIYGKRRVFAEAFTSRLRLGSHPAQFKMRGEELFSEGINHFVLHVYAHQTTDGVPGKNPSFGTAFHRNTPWFNEARNWVRYLQRCHTLLQQGEPVADVAVYIGDFAPQMTGPANPVPTGYDYDYIGSDAILRKLQVVDNEWVVFDEKDPKRIAARWKLLALPNGQHARPQVVRRIHDLKQAGGKVVEGIPVSGKNLLDAGVEPLVSDTSFPALCKARKLGGDGMIFFLSNFKSTGTFEATLRVTGMAPEWFDPVSGNITKLARYRSVANGTRVTLDIKNPSDSFFLIFREEPRFPSVIESTVPPGTLDLTYDSTGRLIAESQGPVDTTLKLSDGTTRAVRIGTAPDVLTLGESWKSSSADPQGFSVLHETTFELPAGFSKDRRVTLDLGEVAVMAKVTINEIAHDTLWRKPYQLDVTHDLKPGINRIRVLVTSTSEGKPALGPATLRAFERVIVE
jgi:hypothetical protein